MYMCFYSISPQSISVFKTWSGCLSRCIVMFAAQILGDYKRHGVPIAVGDEQNCQRASALGVADVDVSGQ